MLAMPHKQTKNAIGGIAHALIVVPKEDAHKVVISGLYADPSGYKDRKTALCKGAKLRHERVMDNLPQGMTAIEAFRHNAFVNIGLRGALDSIFGDLTADRFLIGQDNAKY